MTWIPFSYTLKELCIDTKYIAVWPARRWHFALNFIFPQIRNFVLDSTRFRRPFRVNLPVGGQKKRSGGPPKKNDSRENPVMMYKGVAYNIGIWNVFCKLTVKFSDCLLIKRVLSSATNCTMFEVDWPNSCGKLSENSLMTFVTSKSRGSGWIKIWVTQGVSQPAILPSIWTAYY